MPRREEFLSNMREALQAQDPEWDISPGTPEFKILESVAQQLEGVSRDGLLSTYHFDIDKKVGIELDLFLSLWGFYRIKAQRSTGEVTFRRATVATSDVAVPVTTQVFIPAANGSPTIYFTTIAGAVISAGNTEVTVPIECATGGVVGNVRSYTISGFSTNLAGITEVFNSSPVTGGANSESDEAFRERFRRTFMRNVSGTENQFAAIAYRESSFVNRVNAVSSVEKYREQLQLASPLDMTTLNPYFVSLQSSTFSGGASNDLLEVEAGARFPDGEFYVAAFADNDIVKVHKFSRQTETEFEVTPPIASTDDVNILRVVFPTTAKDAKYVYPPGGEVVAVSLGGENEIIAKGGSDFNNSPDYLMYTFDNDWGIVEEAGCSLPVFYFTPSGLTRLGGPGTIVDITYEYTPKSSRNNPPNVVNKLDVFVDGIDELSIDEQINMPQTPSNIFDQTDENNVDDLVGPDSSQFLREDGVTHPKSGNLFTPLGRSPILNLGSELTVQRFISDQYPSDYKYTLPNATTYYLDEDYWLVKKTSASDSLENLRGSQRSVEGIEWKTPLRLKDGSINEEDNSENETYVFPRRGATEDPETTDLDAPFAVTTQSDGNLTGSYGYVVTWEVNGIESLPSAVRTISVNNQKVLVRFDDFHSRYPGVYIDQDAADKTVYRRFYRTKVATNEESASLGPFYLVNIVRNNSENAWWIDDKADDDLGITQPPKVPPPHTAPLNVSYNYNVLIERLDSQMESVRLVGQDILSHQAELVPMKFNLAVVLVPNSSVVSARNAIKSALDTFLNRKQFSGDLQIADLFATLELVPEVDNVRLLTESEASNEVQKVEMTSNQSTFFSSDTMVFTVDGYSTSSLSPDEQSYTIREALEALPSINEGDTYASFLTNTLSTAPSTETELMVQANENAMAIHELVQEGNDTPIYLQITQFGEDNVRKDEIVRVTASELASESNTKIQATIIAKQLDSGTATLTTEGAHRFLPGDKISVNLADANFNAGTAIITSIGSNSISYVVGGTVTVAETVVSPTKVINSIDNVSENIFTATVVAKQVFKDGTVSIGSLTTQFLHGFLPGDMITVSGVDDDFDTATEVKITSVDSFTVSYKIDNSVDATEKIDLDEGSYGSISVTIKQRNLTFQVERGQLGSTKYDYGSDVTAIETLAWVHLLGDVAVAKTRQLSNANNRLGVSFTLTFLENAFTKANNWGKRSLLDINGGSRVSLETSGDFSSSGLVVKSQGRGSGIEVLANNLQTILDRFAEDIYFVSSQLPVLGGLDIAVRARNTF